MFKRLAKLAVAMAIAAALQIGANSLAYQERGYNAMGGEVLVFPFAIWVEYMAFLREYDLEEYEEYEEGFDGE